MHVLNQSVNQYAFNTSVTIAHGYNKFKNTSANTLLHGNKTENL